MAVTGATVTYRNGHTALRDASFRIPTGTIAALVGVNGSGKSTLFKAIMGFVGLAKGDMLGVSGADIAGAAAIAAFTAAVIAIKWKEFLLHAFDPAQAQAIGLRVKLLHYGLLGLISLTIVGALQAVGIILSVAMLIAPGAIAFLLTRHFSTMLLTSVVIAVAGSLLGVYLSFFLDSAPAPTIVLLLSLVFVFALLHASRRVPEASV
ncbi:MAG: ATP-binding cassette domain-containing protein [Hyphomicrobiales bacterium]|nr:MAG: ATP-binding cassette domain-containing protein [Hyphomicrobiales bacterium]